MCFPRHALSSPCCKFKHCFFQQAVTSYIQYGLMPFVQHSAPYSVQTDTISGQNPLFNALFWLLSACSTKGYIPKFHVYHPALAQVDPTTAPGVNRIYFPCQKLIPRRYRNVFLLFSAHLSEKKCCIVTRQQHPRIPSKWLHREPQLPAGASGLLLKGHLCFTGNRIIKLSARENLRRFFFSSCP